MWLVVDTNQAGRLPATTPDGYNGLTLSPFVLAEVLLRGPFERTDTLKRLSQHTIRVGSQPAEVMEQVAPLTAHEIAKLTPFPATGSEIDLLSRRLFNPADYRSAATWATKVKESHRKLCGGFVTLATRARKKLKGRHIKRLSDFNEALEQLGQGPDSFLGSLIKSSVSHGGRRALELRDAADLHAAVVVNPYLRHYFYGLLYYVISISRLWRQQTLNRDPSATRDDWTDVGVCLYTGDDDVIVSKDSLVQQVFAAVNSKTRVIPADGV